MGLTRIRAEQISNIDYKQAVRVVTTAPVTLAGGAPNQVDNVNLNAGDRILVTGQGTGSQNGLYDVQTLGTGSDGTWVRTWDGNETGEIEAGMVVMVSEGLAYADTMWKLITDNPIIIGTTPLVFVPNPSTSFSTIAANGTSVIANAATSTLTITPGYNMIVTGNNVTDTITLDVNPTPSFTGTIITGNLDVSNNAVITGNLEVLGNTTFINSNVITINDKFINLANNASNASQANGGGVGIGPVGSEYASLEYLSVSNSWNLTNSTTVQGYLSTTGNITGNNLSGTLVTGTLTTNAQPNITSVGTLSSLSVTANVTGGNVLTDGIISASGNIAGGNLTVSLITGTLTTAAQPNVTSLGTLSSVSVTANVTSGNVTTGNVSASGNITGAYIIGSISGNIAGWANTVADNAQPNITSVGLLSSISSSGNISTTGNVNTPRVNLGATIAAPSAGGSTDKVTLYNFGTSEYNYAIGAEDHNVWFGVDNSTAGFKFYAGNVVATRIGGDGTISASGNIQGGNIAGTNLSGSLTTSAQGNITSVGVLTSLSVQGNIEAANYLTNGLVSAFGNITANGFSGNGSALYSLTGTAVTGTVPFANVAVTISANAQPNITSVGTLTSLTVTGNTQSGNLLTGGYVSATGNVTSANVNIAANGGVTFTTNPSTLTYGDVPVTNRYYVDPTRTANYTADGSQARPFATVAAAQTAIAASGLDPQVEPIYIIILGNLTENITLVTPRVYLVGQNGSIHQPIIISGTITINPTSGTLNTNHFSIMGIEVVGPTNAKAIYVTGTFPLRLNVQDIWITANGNSGTGLYQDNTGTGTYTHGGPVKVSHNGTGDVYCFQIMKGTASFTQVETSGATQVGAVGSGATLTFNDSELDAYGDVVVETYGSGVLVVTNSLINNQQPNGYGIKLNAVANVAGTVSLGQTAISVPVGTGNAVWLDPNTTPGLSGVLAYAGVTFYPSTNTTISANIILGPLTTLPGVIANPIFAGSITSTTVGTWTLTDNSSSSLSIDTAGKAGLLKFVTTNAAEGLQASGYLSVAGNITGGNLTLATASGNITGHDILLGGNINATGYISVTGAITATGNVNAATVVGNIVAQGGYIDNVKIGFNTANTGSFTDVTISGSLQGTGSAYVSVAGNITGGNLITTGQASIDGFTIGANTITVAGPTLTIDPNGSGAVDGNVVIQGNLVVNGNMTYINSNNITTNDLTINMANNATSASQANGGGIGVGPAGAEYISLTYASTPNIWVASNGLSVQGVVEAQANISGGNILTAGIVSATGNITGNNIYANTLINGNSSIAIAVNSNVSINANAASWNFSTDGILYAANAGGITANRITLADVSGNSFYYASNVAALIQGNNFVELQTAGNGKFNFSDHVFNAGNANILAAGNITGNVFIGNGSALTGITSIGNVGNCSVEANLNDGNVSISADGQANLATFNLGTMTMLGAYANPNYFNINVSVIGNVNGMMVGPIALGPQGNIQVPDSSRIVIL